MWQWSIVGFIHPSTATPNTHTYIHVFTCAHQSYVVDFRAAEFKVKSRSSLLRYESVPLWQTQKDHVMAMPEFMTMVYVARSHPHRPLVRRVKNRVAVLKRVSSDQRVRSHLGFTYNISQSSHYSQFVRSCYWSLFDLVIRRQEYDNQKQKRTKSAKKRAIIAKPTIAGQGRVRKLWKSMRMYLSNVLL